MLSTKLAIRSYVAIYVLTNVSQSVESNRICTYIYIANFIHIKLHDS